MKPCATKWQQKWLNLEITHPLVQEVATAAEEYCTRWFNNDRSKPLLVLVGDTGTCKTHVARKIFNFCHAMNTMAFQTGKHGTFSKPSAMFYSWPNTVLKFEDKPVARMIVEDASECTLRVIDDIGAENDPWGNAKDLLCQILTRSENAFTVVTTNIDPKEWTTKFDIRIADRLMRNSVIRSLRGVTSYAIWQRTAAKPAPDNRCGIVV
jgi:DNA replication protein DnaC